MKFAIIFILGIIISQSIWSLDYFEDFNKPGKPNDYMNWFYKDQMLPVAGWLDIIPGDGFAHIVFDADRSNDTDSSNPFQDIGFSYVCPGHRLEMRAENTPVRGVGSFIFTYIEFDNDGDNKDDSFDEIDIEIATDDKRTPPKNHPVEPENDGWTDVRFNSWHSADFLKKTPTETHFQPLLDNKGRKISHRDGKFHIYTIDWYENMIKFYIDGVCQQTISKVVPLHPSRVILGVRQMGWTGRLKWAGIETMLIDWVKITPLTKIPPLGTFSVSGKINGVHKAGITVFAAGVTAITDKSGNYTLQGLPNGKVTVVPSSKGLVFSPISTEIEIDGIDQSEVNFTSSISIKKTIK